MIPKAFIKYLYHFHIDRDYFECHEILEEFWKKEEPHEKNSIWVGLILLAVANYHHRRGNFSGAIKTLEKSLVIFNNKKEEIRNLGFKHDKLIILLEEHLLSLKNNQPYQSYKLPITNQNIIHECMSINGNKNEIWGQESNLSNNELIHRHMLRDRSDVIAERNKALNRKKKDNE